MWFTQPKLNTSFQTEIRIKYLFSKLTALILIIRFLNNNPVLPDREKKKKISASSMISSVFHCTPAYSLLKSFFFFLKNPVNLFILGSFSSQPFFFFRSISFYFKKIFFKLWHLKRKIFTFEGNYTLPPKLYNLLYLAP